MANDKHYRAIVRVTEDYVFDFYDDNEESARKNAAEAFELADSTFIESKVDLLELQEVGEDG